MLLFSQTNANYHLCLYNKINNLSIHNKHIQIHRFIVYKKPVLNAGFRDFLYIIINQTLTLYGKFI